VVVFGFGVMAKGMVVNDGVAVIAGMFGKHRQKHIMLG